MHTDNTKGRKERERGREGERECERERFVYLPPLFHQ
jgi:hypothetical protein